MRIARWLGLAFFAATAMPATASEAILLHGGTITTDASGATAEALVAEDGRITFVGGLAEAKKRAPKARGIDLKGAFAYPGFVDGHAHLSGIGLQELTLDLTFHCF